MTTPNTTGPSDEIQRFKWITEDRPVFVCMGCDDEEAPRASAPRGTVPGTSLVCTVCGCRWKQHADGMLQLFDGEQPRNPCCDNAADRTLRPEEPGDGEEAPRG